MRSKLELIFDIEELAISIEFEDMALNKQIDFGHEIWLKVVLFIKVVTPDKNNKLELIFSISESLIRFKGLVLLLWSFGDHLSFCLQSVKMAK